MADERMNRCSGCTHLLFSGMIEPIAYCEVTGWPIDPEGPACISKKAQ